MSLRYGRFFDSTVRTEYERALTAAKAHLGTLPADPPHGRTPLPSVDGYWKHAPAVKARLAGGFCIRAQVQGPCTYANICEHCPNFLTDTGYLPVPAAQRADTETLARDAEARGWTGEAERRRQLIERLDAHISQSQPGWPPSNAVNTSKTPAPQSSRRTDRHFQRLAARTSLGRATLNRNPDLRRIIEEQRAHGKEAHTLSGLTTEIAHLRTELDVISTTVRRHEEELRRLHNTQR